MIDTHTHLYDEAFDEDRAEAVGRAVDAGVEIMLLPAIDSSTHNRQARLAADYPTRFRQMMGLHPTSVNDGYESELATVQEKLFSPDAEYVAVGEIGLDFYWDTTYAAQQQEALKRQIKWAKQLQMPIALHVRKAHNELFALLRDMNYGRYEGVMHCFGGSVQEAWHAVELGLYIGVGGVVTFKNATLAKVVAEIPLERIVLETDAPYLAPVPYRGRRNESAYIRKVAEALAEIRGITLEEVDAVTSHNARSLFSL